MYTGYIYKWENKTNGKVYIGQTMNRYGYKERWSQHRYQAKRGIHNNHFHNAIRKYGVDSFDKNVIKVIKMDDKVKLKNKLDEIEIKYIEKYDSFTNGYNSTLGGDFNVWSSGNEQLIEETKTKMKIKQKEKYNNSTHIFNENNRQVVLIDKEDKLLKNFKSVKEAAEFLNVYPNSIVGKCRCGAISKQKGFVKLSANISDGKILRYQDDWLDGLSENEIRNKYYNIEFYKPEFISIDNDVKCDIYGDIYRENDFSVEYGMRRFVRNNLHILTNIQADALYGDRGIPDKNITMFRKRLLKRINRKISKGEMYENN